MFTAADRRLLIPFHVILPVKDLLHECYHGEGTDEDETEGATPQQVSTSRWIRVAHSRHPAISKDNKISKKIFQGSKQSRSHVHNHLKDTLRQPALQGSFSRGIPVHLCKQLLCSLFVMKERCFTSSWITIHVYRHQLGRILSGIYF